MWDEAGRSGTKRAFKAKYTKETGNKTETASETE